MSRAAPRWPEQKIAQAERDAVDESRSTAVDIAIEAARKVLATKVDAGADAALFLLRAGIEVEAQLSIVSFNSGE